jgi:hypothetical protein
MCLCVEQISTNKTTDIPNRRYHGGSGVIHRCTDPRQQMENKHDFEEYQSIWRKFHSGMNIFCHISAKQWLKITIQDAFVKGVMHRTIPEERSRISLKRKVGYVEEEVSATWARLVEMQIDVQIGMPEKENEKMTNELDWKESLNRKVIYWHNTAATLISITTLTSHSNSNLS